MTAGVIDTIRLPEVTVVLLNLATSASNSDTVDLGSYRAGHVQQVNHSDLHSDAGHAVAIPKAALVPSLVAGQETPGDVGRHPE